MRNIIKGGSMDTLMNFKDALRYLRTSRATLLRLLQKKQIPATKMGRQWRFKKERLDEWLEEHENIRQK